MNKQEKLRKLAEDYVVTSRERRKATVSGFNEAARELRKDCRRIAQEALQAGFTLDEFSSATSEAHVRLNGYAD